MRTRALWMEAHTLLAVVGRVRSPEILLHRQSLPVALKRAGEDRRDSPLAPQNVAHFFVGARQLGAQRGVAGRLLDQAVDVLNHHDSPPRPHPTPSSRARARSTRMTLRVSTPATARQRSWSHASRYRSRAGTLRTHCWIGTSGKTRSTRCAARSAIQRPRHLGQSARPYRQLQESGRMPSQPLRYSGRLMNGAASGAFVARRLA